MERFTGLIGIVVILGIALLMSNNRKAINYRTVGIGLLIQLILAFVVLKTSVGQHVFATLGHWITRVVDFADKGSEFVFGPLVKKGPMSSAFGVENSFIFFFKIIPTIIFVCILVNITYHIGLMQIIVSGMAKIMHKLMKVSGAEALSNVASTFVGQVEAQIVIKPYLKNMTKSELLASMAGSMACIAGGIMAVYIQFGIPAEYLLAASIMAAPGALVISKIIMPETEQSETEGEVKIQVAKSHVNIVDAISAGAIDGLKIGLNVVAMLIAFIALIALLDFGIHKFGSAINYPDLSFKTILGFLFSGIAWCMGVPAAEMLTAGSLMGTKIIINEFVAYLDLVAIKTTLSPKTLIITSFALCGFANIGSVAMQIGGIGELAPNRRADLARLGFKALIAGTLASYLSATIAGMLL